MLILCNRSSSTPEQWEDFSDENILDAESQRQNSVQLRSNIDGILQAVANDMRRQKENTDISLEKRIAETRASKEKLEDHLSKVNTMCLHLTLIALEYFYLNLADQRFFLKFFG